MRKSPIIFCAVVLLTAGCLKQTDFPDEPEIVFNDFIQYPDSAILVIDFTDGDGNFGLEQSDTTGSYCPIECEFYWNFFCEYYEKENGEWVHQYIDWTNPENLPFYYRVPRIAPSGQNPALEGEIRVTMKPFYYLLTDNDTARFEVRIADRSLNVSNTITTPEFIKP